MTCTAVAAVLGRATLWQHHLLQRVLALENASLTLGEKTTNRPLCLCLFSMQGQGILFRSAARHCLSI